MAEFPDRSPARLTKADIYREQRTHHGRLQDIQYKLPVSFSVVIGALWYFAATQLDTKPAIAALVFAFATTCAASMTGAYWTLTRNLQAVREHLEWLEGKRFAIADPKLRFKTRWFFMAMLSSAVGLSIIGTVLAVSQWRTADHAAAPRDAAARYQLVVQVMLGR